MDEDAVLYAISSVGFPAVIAFYVLFQVNSTLEKLTDAVNRLVLSLKN